MSRDDPNADTHDYRYGLSLGGPIASNRTFFFGNYEGSRLKALGGGAQAIVPTAAMRDGDFSANTFVVRDPLTGVPFPGNRIPADRIDPAARRILDFFYPAPEPGATLPPAATARTAQILPLERNRDRADVRVDHELSGRDSLFAPRQLAAARSGRVHVREHRRQRRRRPDQSRPARPRSRRRTTFAGGWTRIWSEHDGQRVPRRLQQRTCAIDGASSSPAQVGAQLGLEVPPLAAERPGLPVVPVLRREPPVRHSRPAAEHVPRSRSVVVLAQQQRDVAERAALDQVRRHLQPQLREGRLLHRSERVEGRVRLLRVCDRQLIRRLPARAAEPGARAAQHARRPADGHVLERLGRVRAGRLQAEPAADAVPGPALRGRSASSSTRTTSTRTSSPTDGGHHVVPNSAIARAAAAGRASDSDRTLIVGPVRRRPRADQDRSEQLQPARRLRLPPRQQQQDGAARRLRDLPSDRRRPGRARHHVAQPVPLHHHAHPAAAAAGLLVRHAERVARLRQPGPAARSRAARTSTSTTSRSSASCPAASAPASATSGRR